MSALDQELAALGLIEEPSKAKHPSGRNGLMTASVPMIPPGGIDGWYPTTPKERREFTPEKRREFLRLFASGQTIGASARAVGVSAVTVYNWRREDEEFAAQWEEAIPANTEALEDHLHEMAIKNEVPGQVVALFGMLKMRRPDRWRENYRVEHTGNVLHVLTTADQLQAARLRAQDRPLEITQEQSGVMP